MADLYNFMLDAQAQIDQINNTLICPICLQNLTDAVRLHCAHHFCKNCISSVVRKNRIASCPICKSIFPKRGFFGSDSHNKLMQVSLNIIKSLKEEISIDFADIGIREETELNEKRDLSALKHETVTSVQPYTDQNKCKEDILDHKEKTQNSRRQLVFKSKRSESIERYECILNESENSNDEKNIQGKGSNVQPIKSVKDLQQISIGVSLENYVDLGESGNISNSEKSESELSNEPNKYLVPLCEKYSHSPNDTADPYTFISSQRTPKRVVCRKDGIKIVKGKPNMSSRNKPKKSKQMKNSVLSLDVPVSAVLSDANHNLNFIKKKNQKCFNTVENLNVQNNKVKHNEALKRQEMKDVNAKKFEDMSADSKENLMDIDIETNDAFDKLVLESRNSARNSCINKVLCNEVINNKCDDDEKEDYVLFKTPLNDISSTVADINLQQNVPENNTKQRRSKTKQVLQCDIDSQKSKISSEKSKFNSEKSKIDSEKSKCSKPEFDSGGKKSNLNDTRQHEPKVNQIPLSTQINLLNKGRSIEENESTSIEIQVTGSSSDVLESLNLRHSALPVRLSMNKHNRKVHSICNKNTILCELNSKSELNKNDETVPLDDFILNTDMQNKCTINRQTSKENCIPEKMKTQVVKLNGFRTVKYIYKSIARKRSPETSECEISSNNYAFPMRVDESSTCLSQSTQTLVTNTKEQETQVECHLTSKSKKTPIYTEKSVQTDISDLSGLFEMLATRLCESCVKQTKSAVHEISILVNAQAAQVSHVLLNASGAVLDICNTANADKVSRKENIQDIQTTADSEKITTKDASAQYENKKENVTDVNASASAVTPQHTIIGDKTEHPDKFCVTTISENNVYAVGTVTASKEKDIVTADSHSSNKSRVTTTNTDESFTPDMKKRSLEQAKDMKHSCETAHYFEDLDNYNEKTDIDSSEVNESKKHIPSTASENENCHISLDKHNSNNNTVNKSSAVSQNESYDCVSRIPSYLTPKANFPIMSFSSKEEDDVLVVTENKICQFSDQNTNNLAQTTFSPDRLIDNSKRKLSLDSEDEESNSSNSQKHPKLEIDFSQLEGNEPLQDYVEDNTVKLSQISEEMDFDVSQTKQSKQKQLNTIEASNTFSHKISDKAPESGQSVDVGNKFNYGDSNIVEILSDSDTDMDDKPTSHSGVSLTSVEARDIAEGTNIFREELESNETAELNKMDLYENMYSAKDTDSEDYIVDTTPGKEPGKTKWLPMGNSRSVNNTLLSKHVTNVGSADNLPAYDSNAELKTTASKYNGTTCGERNTKLLSRTALSFRGLTRKKDTGNQKSPLSVSTVKNIIKTPATSYNVQREMSASLIESPYTKAILPNHVETSQLAKYNNYEQSDSRKNTPAFCITCTLLRPPSLAKLQHFASHFKLSFSRTYTSHVTHVVVPRISGMGKTMKLLFAIAKKKWVVYEDWADKCLEFDQLLHEEPFEVNSEEENLMGPRKSRLTTRLLFKDLRFCFIPPFSFAKKDDLEKLVEYCGGRVEHSIDALTSDRTFPVGFILLEEQEEYPDIGLKIYSRYKIPPLRYHYVADCIAAYSIFNVKEYSLYPLPDSVYASLGYNVD